MAAPSLGHYASLSFVVIGRGRGTEDRGQNFEFLVFKLKTVSQPVIPAKSAGGGPEPGSRNNLIISHSNWIPDLARLSGLVRNDGFGEL